MPLLRRRELAAYMLLLESSVSEYGEAIEVVRRGLCTTKRTARRIVKRLARVGVIRFTKRDDMIRVEVVSPKELVRLLVSGYVESRRLRCGDEEGRTLRGPR